MVYTFRTPWDRDATCNVIKTTIKSMNGNVKEVSPGCLIAKWRTRPCHSKQYHTVFPSKFRFYVGDGVVRAVTGSSHMQMIPMIFKPGGIHIVWNAFIESLIAAAPGVEFAMEPGNVKLVAIKFIGDDTEEVFVYTTKHSPSWGGAAIGGLLFGSAGAVIGGSAGTSYTTGKSSVRFSNSVLAKARYSNGLMVEGVLLKNSPTYQEVLVNMSRLSEN